MQKDKNRIIAEAIRDGNEEVFKAFFRAEFSNILFFVNKYLNNIFNAQDIAQETFLALWNARKQINPELNIRTYTFTIAKNKALNFLRDAAKMRGGTLEQQEKAITLIALDSVSLSEKIEALELEQLIRQVYDILPEKVKKSFILNRQFGLTYEEVAKKMDVSVKVVEYHIVSALQIFRKKLQGYLKLLLLFCGEILFFVYY
jgi:RNA polymerase sigma-70 factor (ECF subfamily)